MKKLFALILLAAIFSACKSKKQQTQNAQDCPDKPCTMMFASVPVRYADKNGQPVSVKNFKAVILRTNEDITHTDNHTGSMFTVADDSDRKKLTEAGDNILITATDSASNVTRTDTIKVAGGVCSCHVVRVSGPEEIRFN
ncbi:hypothetical protein EOD41_08650 [Mucilaginibacter limnophilus]|uniref:Uncharacterized protein n=1 Tax=Mucilaginibacter limnophilus TaxID=1932778 RepID=A0A3S3TIS1_9SPHI|nr:hypothetical protein [Mucilaginibacter limnophilus]RVU02010.1 hypothetical protein EOD41_08650 [Mucilaginibacter limnophilus]